MRREFKYIGASLRSGWQFGFIPPAPCYDSARHEPPLFIRTAYCAPALCFDTLRSRGPAFL